MITEAIVAQALFMLAAGAAAGFLAGLLGIGGGLLLVPALVFVLDAHLPAYVMHVAVGTSLASIVFTSASSVRAHHARGAVAWGTVARLSPGLVVGSLGAGTLAAFVPETGLAWLFAIFSLVAAWQLARPPAMRPVAVSPGALELATVGVLFGAVSALVGIGGGSLNVPYLHWRGQPIHRAVGTAAACGLPIALAGTAGFVLSGWSVTTLPGPRLGFVLLPALAAILVTSVAMAPLGARAAHALPTAQLRRVFAVFLVIMGVLLVRRVL